MQLLKIKFQNKENIWGVSESLAMSCSTQKPMQTNFDSEKALRESRVYVIGLGEI